MGGRLRQQRGEGTLTGQAERQTAMESRQGVEVQQRGDWHLRAVAQVVDALAVDPDRGLDSAEAEARLRQHGPNELVARGLKSPVRILWEQVTEPLVVLLLVAAAISAFLGKADSVVAI